MSEEKPEPEKPPEPRPLMRQDLLPFGSGYQTAIGCAALVLVALVAFYLWRC
jgi:hypothetical protein